MSELQFYVAGFMFDEGGNLVALVRKNRPDWQAGKLNAIGGKIEQGENIHETMVREFAEETGVHTKVHDWQHFATVAGTWGSVAFLRTWSDDVYLTRTVEDEEINVYNALRVTHEQLCMPNLSWLIPLALYRHDSYDPILAYEWATG